MTADTRGAVADLAIVAGAAIGLYFVARNPPLRRTVLRALRYGAFSALPTFLWNETKRAWAESATPS